MGRKGIAEAFEDAIAEVIGEDVRGGIKGIDLANAIRDEIDARIAKAIANVSTLSQVPLSEEDLQSVKAEITQSVPMYSVGYTIKNNKGVVAEVKEVLPDDQYLVQLWTGTHIMSEKDLFFLSEKQPLPNLTVPSDLSTPEITDTLSLKFFEDDDAAACSVRFRLQSGTRHLVADLTPENMELVYEWLGKAIIKTRKKG